MLAGRLEIGLQKSLHIREERLSQRGDSCRLLYVSDIHLRHSRSKIMCQQVMDAVRKTEPDVVLLGGDLVDRVTELSVLCELVRSLGEVAPVMAIGGNHDRDIGLERVRDAVLAGGGEWIHDRIKQVTHRGRVISISGPEASRSDFTDSDVRVLCGHNPRIWKTARHDGYDLVLAGHLHGCQFVAFEFRGRLFPGALFYPYCFLNDQCGSTKLVVSRGVSDLVPVRWQCPREVVLCYV